MPDVLLEQDGTESRIEGANTFILQDLAETTDKAIGKIGLGN